ncbi:hypothetical protein [Parasitella parasitica]|uniref:Uncharacterized protein n=1 Tax=Parasitella parasitica TaxID=35722 RepID=A0A0B7N8H7_9FUNG|nr:hypothetical protein [Parasitella parasitica]
MKCITTLAALVLSAVAVANAQQNAGVYFTNPVLGSVFQANAPYAISWNPANAVDNQIDLIELRIGSTSNLELIQPITTQRLRKYKCKKGEFLQDTMIAAYFTTVGQAPDIQTNGSSVAALAFALSSTAVLNPSAAVQSSSAAMMATFAICLC